MPGTPPKRLLVPPHARRSTRPDKRYRSVLEGSSARAEIDPGFRARAFVNCGFLRTRGDRPALYLAAVFLAMVPPHARRSTFLLLVGNRRSVGSSARAEIDPWRKGQPLKAFRFLRTRGDRPLA